MAKSAKKSITKVVKKAAVKAKVSVKAKKVVKAKVPLKKPVLKAAKKIVTKKEAPKPIARKADVEKKAVSKAPSIIKKTDGKNSPSNQKPQHNLTIFPALTQRPIAHKPAKSSMSDDKTRYSDDELKEFETLIKSKLETSKEEFRILKDTLNRNNDAGTDSTSGGNTKVLEDGAETAEKENLSQLAARQLKYITNLENALVRIKNRTYGICTVTGKLIPKERLIAVPHTTQSIEAKMMQHD
jgi:RNA polymerase-binding transcription factor DksA